MLSLLQSRDPSHECLNQARGFGSLFYTTLVGRYLHIQGSCFKKFDLFRKYFNCSNSFGSYIQSSKESVKLILKGNFFSLQKIFCLLLQSRYIHRYAYCKGLFTFEINIYIFVLHMQNEHFPVDIIYIICLSLLQDTFCKYTVAKIEQNIFTTVS